jgi:hypothetical protein
VFGELVAQFGSHLVIALADMAVSRRKAFQVGDRFNVPNGDVAHWGAFNRLPSRKSTHAAWGAVNHAP